jgi:hypothetical protein
VVDIGAVKEPVIAAQINLFVSSVQQRSQNKLHAGQKQLRNN